MLGNTDAPLGGIEDLEMDMAGVGRDEMFGFFGPLDTGDRGNIIHKILEPDILKFFRGIQPVAIEMIKQHLGLINMHQDKGRAFHLVRMFEPQTFRETFYESGLPAPKLPFETKHCPGFKPPSKALRKLNSFLR